MAIIRNKGTRFLVILILCLGITLYIDHRTNPNITPQLTSTYNAQSTIKNQLKIIIHPILLSKTQPSKIKISLESTQNPSLSQLNILQSALLIDDQQLPYKPTHWEALSQDDYSQTGILTFPPIPKNTAMVSISIFEYNERTFNWKL